MNWIGVDLDGTLAEYHGWKGKDHIGAPLPDMVFRIQQWRKAGREVRIFTARVAPASLAVNGDTLESVEEPIQRWCHEWLGEVLPITCIKDLGMVELYDDRCTEMISNTGKSLRGHLVQEIMESVTRGKEQH